MQQALPVSSTLTAGCHQRHRQSQPAETILVKLLKAVIVTCRVLLRNLYTYKAVIVVISGPVFIFLDSA